MPGGARPSYSYGTCLVALCVGTRVAFVRHLFIPKPALAIKVHKKQIIFPAGRQAAFPQQAHISIAGTYVSYHRCMSSMGSAGPCFFKEIGMTASTSLRAPALVARLAR